MQLRVVNRSRQVERTKTMVDATVGSLTYEFKADTSGLKKGMDEARAKLREMSAHASSASAEMRRGFDETNKSLQGVNAASQVFISAVKTGARGLAAAVAVGLLVPLTKAREQFAELSGLIDSAGKAGVSTNLFQAWTQQATALRLSVKEAESAITAAGKNLQAQFNPAKGNMGELSKRADTLAAFGGPAAGKEALENARTLDQMHQAALLIVRDFQRAADEAKRQGLELESIKQNINAADVATKVWGEEGRKVAESIRDGSLNVDEFEAKSRSAGGIWSGEILRAHQDVNRQLAEAHQHLSNEMQPVMETIERLSISIASSWANVVEGIAQALGSARKLARELDVAMTNVREALPHAQGEAASSVFARVRRKGALPDITIGGRGGDVDAPLPPRRPDDLGAQSRGGHAAQVHKEAQDAVKGYLESLRQAQDVARVEVETWKLGNVEREKALALAKAEAIARKEGRTLSEAERTAITEAASATGGYKDKLQSLREEQQRLNAAVREFADAMSSALEDIAINGKKAKDVLADLARQLASSGIKNALSGGKDGGLLGSLVGAGANALGGALGGDKGLFSGSPFKLNFGGFFADGGTLGAGKWGIAGEKGPELIHGPANIAPMTGGGSPNIIIHNNAAVDVTPQITPQGIMLMIDQRIGQNNSAIPGILADAQRRRN
jgi:hypothetical protein